MVTETKQITLALGCFWGKEFLFQNTPGVVATRVGYTGGHTEAPTYLEVCSKKTGHAEAVEITYDPRHISTEALLRLFFQNHNPISEERQGKQHSGNYRSAIFYHDKEQKILAENMVDFLKNKGYDIQTQVTSRGPFYPAEERHQGYCERTGNIPSTKSYPIVF